MNLLPRVQSPEDTQVPLETVLQNILEDVSEVRAVSVAALGRDELQGLKISAHSADWELHGEVISLDDPGDTWVSLTDAEGREHVVPISIEATSDGPLAPSTMAGRTTLYSDNDWFDESISVPEGLDRLRTKVAGHSYDETLTETGDSPEVELAHILGKTVDDLRDAGLNPIDTDIENYHGELWGFIWLESAPFEIQQLRKVTARDILRERINADAEVLPTTVDINYGDAGDDGISVWWHQDLSLATNLERQIG